jgi:Major Facilitator Superfamily
MAVIASSDAIGASPSSTSLNGLDGINFFLAGMQSGFGPFVAVLLADEKWTQQNIGFVLSLGGFAGLLSQLPGGELLDATRSKRFLIALGGTVVAVSAFPIALWPNRPVVFAVMVLQGLTGGFLGPTIAAISLGLVGHSALAERLGRNQRFASAGALTTTAVMGAIGYKETFSGCRTQRNHQRHRLVACRAARVSFGGTTADLRRSVRQSSQPRGGDAASLRDLEVLDQKRERK